MPMHFYGVTSPLLLVTKSFYDATQTILLDEWSGLLNRSTTELTASEWRGSQVPTSNDWCQCSLYIELNQI